MIHSFGDRATEDLYHGYNTKAARNIPRALWNIAFRKLDMLNAACAVGDLIVPPGNQLEKLKGSLQGFYSIRINNQFRIIFLWHEGNASNVQIVDYH
jgi:toxin HigB-1